MVSCAKEKMNPVLFCLVSPFLLIYYAFAVYCCPCIGTCTFAAP